MPTGDLAPLQSLLLHLECLGPLHGELFIAKVVPMSVLELAVYVRLPSPLALRPPAQSLFPLPTVSPMMPEVAETRMIAKADSDSDRTLP